MKTAYLFQSKTDFWAWRAGHVHIFHTVKGLQRRGHKVTFVGLDGRKVIWTDDLELLTNGNFTESCLADLGLSGSAPFVASERVIRRTQRSMGLPYLAFFDSYRIYDACRQNFSGHDLIHERFNMLGIGGALAARRLNIPLFLEVNADVFEQYDYQGIREAGLRRAYAQWATRFCYEAAAKIIAVSEEQRRHLIERWQIADGKIAVLPCAADTEAFGKSFDVRQIRSDLGFKNESLIMWVGGFYAWHNVEYLLDAFARVLLKLPDAKLVLIGDGRTRTQIERKISDDGLDRGVVMLGRVDHMRIPELLSIADVVVAPSTPTFVGHGGTPLKVFEYMAAGKAIVANSMSQNTAVIRDGVNGILVEPGDVDVFANAIARLLLDPDERQRLGTNARKQAIEQHSWKRYAEQLEEIYMSVL